MRHLILALLLLAAVAPPIAASDAGASTPAPTTTAAGVPPTPAVPPTPTTAQRLETVEKARANLLEQCQRGLAEHNGAIAVLRDMVGGPVPPGR